MPALKVERLVYGRRLRPARSCAAALLLVALLCQLAAPGLPAAAAAVQSLPTITISDASNNEGDTVEGNRTFTVTLSAASTQAVTVKYATADGTAKAGEDYDAQSGTLTFDAGQTRKFITVAAIPDRVQEPDETFFVNLSDATNATIARAQAVGTIVNDDAPGSIQFDDESSIADEGTVEHIGVERRGGKLGAVTVDYTVTGGTATPGVDYELASGTLTLADGETFKQFQIRALDDALAEQTETITLALSNPTGGATLGAQTTHTVLIADSPPRASVVDAKVVEGDSGTAAAVFTVILSSPSTETETVQYKAPDVINGGPRWYSRVATAGSDYEATSGTLTFAPGETVKTFTVPVTGDTERELIEVFGVSISSATVEIRDAYGVGLIMNDDGPPLIGTAYAVEAESCAPANRAPDAGETVTVSFCLRNVGPADTTNLVATLRPAGGVTSPGDAQTYGALAVGGSPICRSFTFRVDPSLAPGQAVAATLDLQDGANALAPGTFQIVVSRREPLRENFDDGGGNPPEGWHAPSIGEQNDSQWFLSSEASDSFPHSFAASTQLSSPRELFSPRFTVNTPQAALTFRHRFDLAEGVAGTVLDISLDDGQTYADIVAAGGTFVSGGYTGTNSTVNRPAWNGNSGGFITTAINLPAAAAGRSLRLRWKIYSGNSTGRAGHFLDNVLVADSLQPCGAPPGPPAPVLLTEDGTERALALNSVTLVRGPFPVKDWHNLSADGRTRLALYARNVALQAGEDAAALTAQAEDSRGAIHQLAVEHVGPLPGVEGATQINVVLPDALSSGGDFRVSVKLRGQSSNKVLISVKPEASP